jgi:hypothetical protein
VRFPHFFCLHSPEFCCIFDSITFNRALLSQFAFQYRLRSKLSPVLPKMNCLVEFFFLLTFVFSCALADVCSGQQSCDLCTNALNCVWLNTNSTSNANSTCVSGNLFGPFNTSHNISSSQYKWALCSLSAMWVMILLFGLSGTIVLGIAIASVVIIVRYKRSKGYQRLNDKWDEYVDQERRTFEEKTREQEQQEKVKAAQEKQKEIQRQRKAFPTKWKNQSQNKDGVT